MPDAREMTVLVVDDEPNVRQYLATLLRDAEFNVLTAEDGEQALEIIRERRPDFISLDLVMPRRSGHKLLFELKRDPELARIPVLIVTAHARTDLGKADLDELLDHGMMSGPGTYLEKPVSPRAYIDAVRRALGLAEVQATDDRIALREELEDRMQMASPEQLRAALGALNKIRNKG